MSLALIVMAKRPAAGQTKTRLCPPLTLEDSAELYNNFLHDLIPKLQTLPTITTLIAHPPDDLAPAYFQQLAPDVPTILQIGDTLGERLDHVIRHCFAAGFTQVAAINSDSPTIPEQFYLQAFEQLDRADVDAVFGPCDDGGYYLIGLKQSYPPLTRNVQMSTPHVLDDTLVEAQKLGLRVQLLPTWYDVDDQEKLARLSAELTPNPALAPHTHTFLTTLNL
ncbi:MAG TPA: glycosyltransferase [Anaerolineae bacterium]|nr:glycosyltransferase [Anaerolineae bacterium]